MKKAKANGCQIMNGLSMFLYQAQASFDIWMKDFHNVQEELKIAYDAMEKALKEHLNIKVI